MSASNQKKARKDQITEDWINPKTAKEQQEQKEQRRSRMMYISIAVIFVIVALLVIVWKSGVFQKQSTAATIHNVNYPAPVVEYYYRNAYSSFVNNYSSYLSYFGLDTTKSLKDQESTMGEDGGTWYDYFVDQGLNTMSSVYALNDAADADGFDEWSDEMQSQLDSAKDSLDSTAESAGYSTKQYIGLMYNGLVSQDLYEEQTKLAIRAQAYSTQYQDSLTYSDDQITATYDEDPKVYDVVDYESVAINGAASATTDDEGNTVEATDEEKATALANAKTLADSIYASYKDGESLSDLADANDTATYTDGTGGTYAEGVLMNWLYDDTRKDGDSTVLADESTSTYYVAVFHQRYRNDYNTVDVRHILIEPEQSTLAESDAGYADDVAQKKAAAKQKAEDILAQWKAGAATEDSFAELANQDSSDTGSNTKGGLYKQVYKGQMVQAFSDWCFDDTRKTGDTGVVETDYGYHVMYFVGEDIPYWKVQVTNALKQKDYDTWYSSKTKDYSATKSSFGMKFVG